MAIWFGESHIEQICNFNVCFISVWPKLSMLVLYKDNLVPLLQLQSRIRCSEQEEHVPSRGVSVLTATVRQRSHSWNPDETAFQEHLAFVMWKYVQVKQECLWSLPQQTWRITVTQSWILASNHSERTTPLSPSTPSFPHHKSIHYVGLWQIQLF